MYISCSEKTFFFKDPHLFIFLSGYRCQQGEVGERKDRVTDALNATRATVEEGIVPGKNYSF